MPNCSRRELGYFIKQLHLPHAIAVRLYELKMDIFVLTTETAGLPGRMLVGCSIQDEAVDGTWSAPQGLTTMRMLFTCFLNWE